MARKRHNTNANMPPVDPTFGPAPQMFTAEPAIEYREDLAAVTLQAEIDRLRAELDTTRAERDHARAVTAASPAALLDPELWPHFRVSVKNGPAWVVKAPDAANAWPAFCQVTGMLSNGAENPVNITPTEEPVGRAKE